MTYNPATDFIGLWRNSGGSVSKAEMPGLDFVVAALTRAGLITVSVSATAPGANQSTTAWLQTNVPDWAAEGSLHLWDKIATTYAAATPALFLDFLEACSGESGVSWWTATGGAPANTVGSDGDFAFRLDAPYGVYGPKALGAWPTMPIPGTADVITSTSFDNAFGATPGSLIYRDAAAWQARNAGPENSILAILSGMPSYTDISSLLDDVTTSLQGSILFRNATQWTALGPADAGNVLTTNGGGNDPSWTPKSSEFASGTVMLFQQTAAPTGWTKQTSYNDYGLRVVSGAASASAGSSFSSVFSQTAVGGTGLTIAQLASHTHDYTAPSPGVGTGGTPNYFFSATVGATTTATGSGALHDHSVNLDLAYVDVIIAQKD